jgi:hypothetical protein
MKINLKSILKTISSILFIGLLQSCFSNCNEIKLSQADKSWIAPYSQTKSVIFKSDGNNQDTFFLKDKYEDYTTCSKFELGPNVYNYAAITFESKNVPKSLNKKFSVRIEKDYSHESLSECIIGLSIFDLDSRFDNLKDSKLIFEKITNPYDGRNYNTFKFTRGDRFTSTPSRIKSYNWSKEEGLISYEMASGEIFYLIRKH